MSANQPVQSGYDYIAQQYEAPISLNDAVHRAHHPLFKIDSTNVDAPAQKPKIKCVPHSSVQYPIYDPGATGKATQVVLPANIGNPTPLPDQYLHTSPHINHMFTTLDLPPILFRLEPFSDNSFGGPVPILCTLDGRPVTTSQRNTLRYFAFLPRFIAHDVSGAILEFWFRLDHRLEMNDILDRMEPYAGATHPTANLLNMRRGRFREDIKVLAWRASRPLPTRKDVDIVGKLDQMQVCFNTSMKVDLDTGRFWKPSFPGPRCKAETGRKYELKYVDAGLPLDHFLQDLVTTIPTRRMIGVLLLRRRTQEFAIQLGHGTHRKNYRLLSDNDRPPWWSGGKLGGEMIRRTIKELPGSMTHAQYMDTEIGPDQMIGLRRRAATRKATQAQPADVAAAPVAIRFLPPATIVAAAVNGNRHEEKEEPVDNRHDPEIMDQEESDEGDVMDEEESEDEDAEFELE